MDTNNSQSSNFLLFYAQHVQVHIKCDNINSHVWQSFDTAQKKVSLL